MMKHLNGKTAVLYRRVSTTEQKDYGMSLSNQSEQLRNFCNRNNIEVVQDFEEDYSAKDFNRPVFSELLKFVAQNKNRIDYLLINNWDRFSRNTLDLLQVIEKFKRMRVSLHFTEFGEVTGSDAMGSVFVKLLSVFAEFYSKQCSEKQKATKDRLKSQGKFFGGKKPFGYDVDQNNYLVPCEKEQQVIRDMQLMRKQGTSYQKVADHITKTTRKKFPVSWVFKILNREGVTA